MRELKVSDLSRYEIDGWDDTDYPDYCDAYIGAAWDKDDNKLNDDELTWLNENDYDGVGQAVQDSVGDHLAGDY